MDIKQIQEQYSSLKSQIDKIADEVENLKDNERKLTYVITDEKTSIEHKKIPLNHCKRLFWI